MGNPLTRLPRVALVNLGCRVNRVELDMMALALQQQGCELVAQRDADAIVVNTCAVTGEAEAKTRKAVRHAAHLPQQPLVVATGCVANLFGAELAALAPNVVVEPLKMQVPQLVLEKLAGGSAGAGSLPSEHAVLGRMTPTGRTRPGIKIQDGCDNHCTFCIVWKARGHSCSYDAQDIVSQIREAQARGAREVVLTGINLGNYRGCAADGRAVALPGLLERILDETDVERVRLSSIEPPDVNDELLQVMVRAGERVAPFLHICLQAGCDKTLREMGRVYDTGFFAEVVANTRAMLPHISLGTDLIVGFPGETDGDFAQTLAFCERMAFSKMHVFRYSRRPGTPAAARTDQVEPSVVAKRSSQMLALAQRMRSAQAAQHVGCEELVVVQYPGRGVSGGLFDVLVDDEHPLDSLVRATVAAVLPDGTLDARSRRTTGEE